MSRFKNLATGVIVSVADEKDHRFSSGWELVDGAPTPEPESKPAPAPEAPPTPPTPEAPAATPTPEQATPSTEVVEPPRSGPGSGRDAWSAYAAARGVTVADSQTRDDLIAAVDALT